MQEELAIPFHRHCEFPPMEKVFLVFLFGFSICMPWTNAQDDRTPQDEAGNSSNKFDLLTADLYGKLFRLRRKEHKMMAKQMLGAAYDKNFRLLDVAYKKIFQVIAESNATLTESHYAPSSFPSDDATQQEALVQLLENCCIAGELLLHFPEISYAVFRKAANKTWKATLNWCNGYLFEFPHIIDESTVSMWNLVKQEINEELRSENYVNPYYTTREPKSAPVKQKKARPKLKKGPQLNGRMDL